MRVRIDGHAVTLVESVGERAGADTVVLGPVGWLMAYRADRREATAQCADCCGPVAVADGVKLDGRSAVQAVWNYEGSEVWRLAHRVCS